MKVEIDETDYINASWISGKKEIATQGPMPNTIIHFLQMICEQKIDAIVMLTRTFEETLGSARMSISSGLKK